MNVLCFGDSNTWGHCPEGGRWARDVRWPGALQALMPDDYVVENGLCGRTTVFDDPLMPGRRGFSDLNTLLDICQPLDWFVVMLGTNDTKSHLNADPVVIDQGLRMILNAVKSHPYGVGTVPKLLVIAPAAAAQPIEGCPFAGFDARAAEKSREIIPLYQRTADEFGAIFLDANTVAHVGIDKIHLTRDSHLALAQAVAAILRQA